MTWPWNSSVVLQLNYETASLRNSTAWGRPGAAPLWLDRCALPCSAPPAPVWWASLCANPLPSAQGMRLWSFSSNQEKQGSPFHGKGKCSLWVSRELTSSDRNPHPSPWLVCPQAKEDSKYSQLGWSLVTVLVGQSGGLRLVQKLMGIELQAPRGQGKPQSSGFQNSFRLLDAVICGAMAASHSRTAVQRGGQAAEGRLLSYVRFTWEASM